MCYSTSNLLANVTLDASTTLSNGIIIHAKIDLESLGLSAYKKYFQKNEQSTLNLKSSLQLGLDSQSSDLATKTFQNCDVCDTQSEQFNQNSYINFLRCAYIDFRSPAPAEFSECDRTCPYDLVTCMEECEKKCREKYCLKTYYTYAYLI
jgi:hypothetical protein